jgi:phosphoribosylaminoimidazolecarboxamide formyltransferase/IMP cyclohydrolase
MTNRIEMRYGCNPHQVAARCYMPDGAKLPIRAVNDAPSYINLMDALNSWQLVSELRASIGLPAAASFKHVSPAGAAVGVGLDDNLREALFVPDLELTPLACAYARARGADRVASYGDWIALSDPVDVATAQLIRAEVSDGLIAPGFEEGSLEILRKKKGGSYRILEIDSDYVPVAEEVRDLFGLRLAQRRNEFVAEEDFLKNVVTVRDEISAAGKRDLIVATIAVKYTQSNSVCLAVDGQVIGTGAGQQSRVHCVRLAGGKADLWHLRQHPSVRGMRFAKGLKRPERDNAIDLFLQDDVSENERDRWKKLFDEVPQPLSMDERRRWLNGLSGVALSSDAYFPFRDSIDRASRSGVEYVVQAGGSIMDRQVTEAADECGMVMICSGVRLFHH